MGTLYVRIYDQYGVLLLGAIRLSHCPAFAPLNVSNILKKAAKEGLVFHVPALNNLSTAKPS